MIGIAPDRFPETAAGRLLGIGSRASIFNDYNDGGYLIWRLWPHWKVSMDGRADVYGPELIRTYEKIWSGDPAWEKHLTDWGVQAVLGRTGGEALAARPGVVTVLGRRSQSSCGVLRSSTSWFKTAQNSSADHGTAFDIAWTGKANSASMAISIQEAAAASSATARTLAPLPQVKLSGEGS